MGRRLYVGNLSCNSDREMGLRDLFGQLGHRG